LTKDRIAAADGQFSRIYQVAPVWKKLVKQQYLLQKSPQYGELRPTSGWDRCGSLGHPS